MRKKLAVALALTCAIAMTACGGASTTESTAADTAAASTAESVVEEPAPVVDESVTEAENPTDDIAVMTYDEYMAAAVDDPVAIETYVQAKQGWWEDAASIYAQCAADGQGVFIYNMPISQEDYDALVPGTKILVQGFKAEWSGEIEIADATYEVIEGDTMVAEPVDVTELLGTDDLANYQNCFVSFKDLVIAPTESEGAEVAYIYNWDGSGQDGDDLYFNVSKGDATYSFTVESYLTGAGTDVYEAVKALEVGQTVDLEGYLYWYEGANPHITSVTVK